MNMHKIDLIIAGKYRLGRKIGQGSFGDIYLGVNIETFEEVAVKLEQIRCSHHQLLFESRLLRSLQGFKGIPKIYWYGVEGDYNIMIIELLGPSLSDLLYECRPHFSLQTIFLIAEQILTQIEYLHCKTYLHRDIKPDNFLIGLEENQHTIYMIDYGLAKKYCDRNGQHIPYKENKKLVGTARYASINTHNGIEQSRRDDLECLGYTLVYLAKGTLPWQGLLGNNKKEKYRNIANKKISTSVNALCENLPEQFVTFINYSKSLSFEERPDYCMMKRIFRGLVDQSNVGLDWTYLKLENKRTSRNPSPGKTEITQPLKPKSSYRKSENESHN